jgi:hypothetical protein
MECNIMKLTKDQFTKFENSIIHKRTMIKIYFNFMELPKTI